MSARIVSAARFAVQKWQRLVAARDHAEQPHVTQGHLTLAHSEVKHANLMLADALNDLQSEIRKAGQ